MQIHEIMSKEIISIDCDATIIEACKRFYRHKIGSLVVLEDGKLKGIITERDIIARVVILNKDPNETTVEEIMSPEVITLNQNTNIEEAIKLMNLKEIKKIPIISEMGSLVGMLTTSDIIEYENMIAGKES